VSKKQQEKGNSRTGPKSQWSLIGAEERSCILFCCYVAARAGNHGHKDARTRRVGRFPPSGGEDSGLGMNNSREKYDHDDSGGRK